MRFCAFGYAFFIGVMYSGAGSEPPVTDASGTTPVISVPVTSVPITSVHVASASVASAYSLSP